MATAYWTIKCWKTLSRTSLGTRVAMWTHLLGMTIRACVKVFMVFIPDEESSISTKQSRFQQFQSLHPIIDCTQMFIQLQSATWSDYKHHTTMKLFVYEYDLILRNKCLRDIIFIYLPAVPNRFKYRHNACFRDIYFKTNFSAISNSLKYHQNA